MAGWTNKAPGRERPPVFIDVRNFGFSERASSAVNRQAIILAINELPLNTGNAFLSPASGANGGRVILPRGEFGIGTGIIPLKRGVRIEGESSEATRLYCESLTGVFQYEDDGGYLPDPIIFESLGIWQSGTPTEGAAIDMATGAAAAHAISFGCRDLIINGTYKGIVLGGGIICELDRTMLSHCESHGVEVPVDGTHGQTTSTHFCAVYSSNCGGDGFRINSAAYCKFSACASDSNDGYGYNITNVANLELHGGAEANASGGALLTGCAAAKARLTIVDAAAGTAHGVTLDGCTRAEIAGVFSSGAGATGYAVAMTGTSSSADLTGVVASSGAWVTNVCNSQVGVFRNAGTLGRILGGIGRRWSVGVAGNPPAQNMFTVGGELDSGVTNAVSVSPTFTNAGAINASAAIYAETANTAVTYAVLAAYYIANVVKGAASTITRSYGMWVQEQTRGGTANANLLLGDSAAAAGNWNVYSPSTRDSVWFGKHRFVSSTGPTISFGSGSPESVLTAPIGSIYGRTDGGANTSFYVKESGTGNTGWVAK